jgi:hypothetical protein
MKLSVAVSALVLLLPTLAQAVVLPRDGAGELVARARPQRQGQQQQQQQQKPQQQNKPANGGANTQAQGKGGRKGQGQGGKKNGGAAAGGNTKANGGNTKANGGNKTGGGNTKANGGNNNNNNNNNGNKVQAAQSSTTLDPSQIQPNLAKTGQEEVTEAGQVKSLTSTNNFINFCMTQKLPLTDGQQKKDGSCNPTPMGVIVSQSKMPSAKFLQPKNGATVKANKAFDIKLATINMQTGNFVNPKTNYFAAPAQVNGNGVIIAHSHVVVQKIPSVDSTEVPDPTIFAFFKGLNAAADKGVLTATVSSPTSQGLPAGSYRLCSINTAANHQPVLVAVAQHGSLDDCVYFTAK